MPKLLLVARRGRKARDLNDDVLVEIFRRPELCFEDVLQISLASHHLRALVMPLIFGKHTWSPWRVHWRSFPAQTLWPHIRVFIVVGTNDWGLLDVTQRDFLVSRLQLAVGSMTAAHTFIFRDIRGGIWPQMLQILVAAPALTHLILKKSPWLGEDQHVFDLPPTLRLPPLRQLSYAAPRYMAPSHTVMRKTKRPQHMLVSEVHNLRSVLRACHSNLESLTLPGELILRSFDVTLIWNSLRELYIEGYCPDHAHAQVSLLSIFRILPNLRIASIRWYAHGPSRSDPIAPKDMEPRSPPDTLLPRLRQFEVASLVPGDRILSVLPTELERLAIIEYPAPPAAYRHPRHILRASEFLDTLAGVHFPAVTHLELWYKTDSSDKHFLRCLARAFLHLRRLEMRRFIGPDMDPTWNPAPILQHVLAELKDLRVFVLEPDAPERRDRWAMRGIDHKYARYIRRLKAVAEEIVLMSPWLQKIQMYITLDDELYLQEWKVVSIPGQGVCLRLPFSREDYWGDPELYDIMEGPLQALEDEPESASESESD
ncbi:hypothetical protein B0H11DRAFT_2046069 [Mycena galericulata]|nr:hypothetical protein B0H11DRAFT_2046069 [Mycena galericulata]